MTFVFLSLFQIVIQLLVQLQIKLQVLKLFLPSIYWLTTVSSRVPQGSILDSIFFNAISQFLDENCIIMFANNTTLLGINKSIERLEIFTFVGLNGRSQFIFR